MNERPSNRYLENLSDDEKRRLGYVEGRPDLFETKILDIEAPKGLEKHARTVLIATRDPGSGGALLPIMKELESGLDFKMVAIVDGIAEDIIRKNFKTKDITPENFVLSGIDKVHPDAILMEPSEEQGIDFHVDEALPDVPKVLVEDYYSSSSIFLKKAIERGLSLPDKICVMDEGARAILVKKFPVLEGRIEITGQPVFDRIAKEDTEKISSDVRKRLNLKSSDSIVSFMSTIDGIEKIEKLAEALKKVDKDFYFIFRRHPRDNVSYEVYKEAFTRAGIKIIDSEGFTVDEVGAASDVVLTTWSTVGIDGIYRRKPVANIIDFNFPVPEGYDFPLVPVKVGASVGIDSVEGISEVLPELLDKKSPLNKRLLKNMEKYYLADGKNARRVADVIRGVIK